MGQHIIETARKYDELDAWLAEAGVRHLFLVCDRTFYMQEIYRYFEKLEEHLGVRVTVFDDFSPNPSYESVEKGVRLFHEQGCDAVAGGGGGSAMDVAKCIKLFASMDPDKLFLKQEFADNHIPLLAIPTTAGTGSESTRYAVIYYQGEKQSITHNSCIPGAVLLDAAVLDSLPEYQRKATMMDALCHAVESFWSVNSTEESQGYSAEAIRLIRRWMDAYLANDPQGNAGMLSAANLAGKAINITQTTAGHAMCYKLTTLYGISHGHAAAICVNKLWPYMLRHTADCIDPRGEEYLKEVFARLAAAMTAPVEGSSNQADGLCPDAGEGPAAFAGIMKRLDLAVPAVKSEEDYEILKHSVNPVRLKNHPIALDTEQIDALYHEILEDVR